MLVFCLHTPGCEFETLIEDMDKTFFPKFSCCSGGADILKSLAGVNGCKYSREVERTFRAAMVMDENVVRGRVPATSGTLAVLNRLETPLKDSLSVA